MQRPEQERLASRRIAALSRLLDPVSLRVFRAAVEARSLARAAERENIALSAASRRVAELEARLGTPLLHRHDRGVLRTAAGEVLMPHLSVLFDPLDRIGADLDAFATGQRGHVRLQANMSAVSGMLPEALAGRLLPVVDQVVDCGDVGPGCRFAHPVPLPPAAPLDVVLLARVGRKETR